MKKILLLSMPFGALERQALGLSLFKSRLAAEDIICDMRYLTFTFADLIGVDEYCWISTEIPHTAFAGEWVFVPCLYGPDSHTEGCYVREIFQNLWQLDDYSIERILRAQTMAPYFIEHCLEAIPWNDYAVVAFTSTFEQNIASLALAQRVKSKYPKVKIVFGGANWEGEMGVELLQCFPFVDYAFSGEADEGFPAFVRLVLSGRMTSKACAAIPGLIRRSHNKSVLTRVAEPLQNLNNLPIPDYSDYFRDLSKSSASSIIVPTLLFEGSRGCWWGEKHHCKFCGLNGTTLKYRAKSPERALQEIKHLVRCWKFDTLQAVDNVIPMQYFRDLFPALAQTDSPSQLFYEIRANLSREQVKTLHDARVLNVQPGIESFSNHVLKLMNKGTTALQNIQLLKWCREYGIQAHYNILYGFPGETNDDYQRMFGFLQSIRFLNSPTACGPIRLDHFSPYFIEAQNYGFLNVRPMQPYKYIYPFGEESVRKIAYFFDYDLAPGMTHADRSAELVHWVDEWKRNPERGTLQEFDRPDGTLALLDTRSYAVRSSVTLQGIDKAVYEYCDRVQSLKSVCDHLAQHFPRTKLSEDTVRSFLEAMIAHGYMLSDGSGYLSLALHSQPVASV